jgi:hypothetical protein
LDGWSNEEDSMGSWGTTSFENDTALDWLAELDDGDSVDGLFDALDIADRAYLEAPDGEQVIAASEVVAALGGRASEDLPEEIISWVARHPDLSAGSYRAMSLAALDRVLAEDSELLQLWSEGGDEALAWRRGVEALRERIRQISEAPPAARSVPRPAKTPTARESNRPWWKFWG